mgnify:CR=1 FL=1
MTSAPSFARRRITSTTSFGSSSVSGSGRVSELRLRYLYTYRITDDKGRDLVTPSSIELVRDLTYDDSNVLAKQQEEKLLWRDMENDLVQQLMRRLAASKPVFAAAPE